MALYSFNESTLVRQYLTNLVILVYQGFQVIRLDLFDLVILLNQVNHQDQIFLVLLVFLVYLVPLSLQVFLVVLGVQMVLEVLDLLAHLPLLSDPVDLRVQLVLVILAVLVIHQFLEYQALLVDQVIHHVQENQAVPLILDYLKDQYRLFVQVDQLDPEDLLILVVQMHQYLPVDLGSLGFPEILVDQGILKLKNNDIICNIYG